MSEMFGCVDRDGGLDYADLAQRELHPSLKPPVFIFIRIPKILKPTPNLAINALSPQLKRTQHAL